jgi:hypothetical protein
MRIPASQVMLAIDEVVDSIARTATARIEA